MKLTKHLTRNTRKIMPRGSHEAVVNRGSANSNLAAQPTDQGQDSIKNQSTIIKPGELEFTLNLDLNQNLYWYIFLGASLDTF